MSPKHRWEKIKREHTVISEIIPLLQEIAELDDVQSIIPGRINRRRGSGHQPYLQLQYVTETGLKLLGKTSSSVQEVFIVTHKPDLVSKKMERKGYTKL